MKIWLGICCLALKTMFLESPSRKPYGHRNPSNRVLPDSVLFGGSHQMMEVRKQASRICRTNIPVLITGEGGTGKEVLARWIHAHSEFLAGEFLSLIHI